MPQRIRLRTCRFLVHPTIMISRIWLKRRVLKSPNLLNRLVLMTSIVVSLAFLTDARGYNSLIMWKLFSSVTIEQYWYIRWQKCPVSNVFEETTWLVVVSYLKLGLDWNLLSNWNFLFKFQLSIQLFVFTTPTLLPTRCLPPHPH